MRLYSDSAYEIRPDLDAIHDRQIDALGDPGTWWSGPQRIAIAEAARHARCEAGLQESNGYRPRDLTGVELPPPARRVARQLAVDPQSMESSFYESVLREGLTDAEYVETVGLISRLTNFDVMARGLGVPMRALPVPRDGEPSRERPSSAMREGAWAPTVPAGRRGGEDAKALYGDAMMPFIIRALSLVPAETHAHVELEQVQYLPLDRFGDYEYQHHEGLTRPQVEVVAGRVSAINECFY